MQRSWPTAFVFLVVSPIALSDQSIDLLRLTCIPELRYFEIEGSSYSILAEAIAHGFDSFSPEGVEKRLRILQTHGLYSPRNLKYDCKLPQATFQLVARQPPASERGMCGSSPTASFSLSINGQELFRDVLINEGCFDRPSVASITMSVGKRGWKPAEIVICLKEKPSSEVECKFSGATFPDETGGEMAAYGIRKFPITQDGLMTVIGK